MSLRLETLINGLTSELDNEGAAFYQRPAADFGEYMKRVGRCQGLQKGLEIINGMLSDTDKGDQHG